MHRIVSIAVWLLVVSFVCNADEQPGRFWLKVIEKGKEIEPVDGIVRIESSSKIRLIVRLQAASLSDGSELLDIRALNQHPDYWKHRLPPNVTLKVEQLDDGSAVEAKIRIYSSGGGVDLRTHLLYVGIHIVGDDAVRQPKLRQFAEWLYQAGQKLPAFPPIERERYIAEMIRYLDESYVYNPPGRYRIVAHFQPATRTIWPVELDSEPLLIDIVEAGDPFEKLKRAMENSNK
jgi:hypothetical protein